MRASRSRLNIPHSFSLTECADELPAGTQAVIVEEERMEGRGFIDYPRTTFYLEIAGHGLHAERTELRLITEADLTAALALDRTCFGPVRPLTARAAPRDQRKTAAAAG